MFTSEPPLDRGRVVHTDEEFAAFQVSAVGDLRSAAGRYPEDEFLRALVTDLRERSPRFRALWDAGVVGPHVADVKTVHHPDLGPITLDCDVLTVEGSDLRLVVLSAEPGTPAEKALATLRRRS